MAVDGFHARHVCDTAAGECITLHDRQHNQTSNCLLQYGKMSEIYGRKSMLSVSYILFIVGLFVR